MQLPRVASAKWPGFARVETSAVQSMSAVGVEHLLSQGPRPGQLLAQMVGKEVGKGWQTENKSLSSGVIFPEKF